jgi:hypothetical protein
MALPLLAMLPAFMEAMKGLKGDIASGQQDRLAGAQGGNPGMGDGAGMLSQSGGGGGIGGIMSGFMPPSGRGTGAMDAMSAVGNRRKLPEE